MPSDDGHARQTHQESAIDSALWELEKDIHESIEELDSLDDEEKEIAHTLIEQGNAEQAKVFVQSCYRSQSTDGFDLLLSTLYHALLTVVAIMVLVAIGVGAGLL